ncbi:pYEATS domain-containing protein [Runella sp.]|uniref:pYEATS domain-containing protein n=1 Tax=Runella sp. TaxID=1960881 RepID=UPI003D0CE331
MTVQEKLTKTGPKRLLAIDGGGVRGVFSLEVLAQLERSLRQEDDKPDTFVLSDYYDYIAGTGSGAFIAACLSLGMRVEAIQTQFTPIALEAFTPTDSLYPVRSQKRDENLNCLLQDLFGKDTLLGSDKFKTLLLLVLKAADSDSPWAITNNPNAFYNQPSQPKSNLGIPIWQLIKASLTTPSFTSPEQIQLPEANLSLVDGSVSIYKNPAFLLFLNATARSYQINWPVGEEQLLLTSVGTGRNPGINLTIGPKEINPLFQMDPISSGLLQSSSFEQDFLCRFFGRCLVGDVLTQEIGDMVNQDTGLSVKLFTYLRYDVELSDPTLLTLGLSSIPADSVQALDAIDALTAFQMIGRAFAQYTVNPAHFMTAGNKASVDKTAFYLTDANLEKGVVDPKFSLDNSINQSQQEVIPDTKSIKIAQDYEYMGEESWKWWIWIEGSGKILDRISHVTYYLHSSFPNPVRTITDRKSKFELKTSGWGVFRIRATVTFKNGEVQQLTHYLKLGYPDGSFTAN